MADENGNGNGRSRISWPTFFAGCGLFITIGVIVVSALTGQWSVQFASIHKDIEHEREITALRIELSEQKIGRTTERERFDAEIAKFKKEPPVTITTTQSLPVTK